MSSDAGFVARTLARIADAAGHPAAIVVVIAGLGLVRLPLLGAAPIAIAAAMEAVDRASDLALEDGLSFERACYERTLVSQDRLEALAAFAAKRKPVFRGE